MFKKETVEISVLESLIGESALYGEFIQTSLSQTIIDLKETNSKIAKEKSAIKAEMANLAIKLDTLEKLEIDNGKTITSLEATLEKVNPTEKF